MFFTAPFHQRTALLAFFLLTGLSHSPPPVPGDTNSAAGPAGKGQIVLVAQNGLKFQPPKITAALNENVTFVFFAKNHTLTQTSLEAPCTPASKSFDTGYITVPVNSHEYPTMILTVTTTKPIYFACIQKKHCEMGMVGGINLPPSGPGALEEFTLKAKALMSAPAKEAKKS